MTENELRSVLSVPWSPFYPITGAPEISDNAQCAGFYAGIAYVVAAVDMTPVDQWTAKGAPRVLKVKGDPRLLTVVGPPRTLKVEWE
jgi:hypothetical protein